MAPNIIGNSLLHEQRNVWSARNKEEKKQSMIALQVFEFCDRAMSVLVYNHLNSLNFPINISENIILWKKCGNHDV